MQIDTTKAAYTRWLLSYMGAAMCNYIFLASMLNSIEFYYSMSDDKNRAKEARELRDKYISDYGDDILDSIPAAATVLEVLVTLAIHAEWIERQTPYTWFIIFLENMGLDFLVDINWTPDGEAFVVSTVHKWLDRRFSPNGSGSPFRSSIHDLTTVTIWNSLQWYIADEFGGDHL